MKPRQGFPLAWIILSPFLLAVAFSITPRPRLLNTALEGVRQMVDSRLPDGAALKNQEVLAWEPWRIDLWEQSATLAFAGANWDGAIALFLKAQSQGTLSQAGLTNLGEAYLQKGDWMTAVRTWAPLLQAGSAGSELFEKVLDLQWTGQDFAGAGQTARLWLQAEPGNAQPAYRLGLLLCLDHGLEGLPYLLQAAGLDASLSVPIETLRTAIQKGNLENNVSYQRVLLGQALGSLGYWDLAQVEFERAVQADPGYAEGWAYLGEARQHLDQDGLPDLQRAEQLNPASIATQGLLALWYRRNGQAQEAIRYLSALAALEPDQSVWQMELGNTFVQAGDLFQAYASFKRATELEPNSISAWQALADFSVTNLFEIGQVGQPAAARLLELAPDLASGLVINGRVSMALGDWQGAERFLQQALQKDAALPEAYFYLGQFFLGQNRMDEARKNLSRAESLAAKGSNIQVLASRLMKQYFGEN
jgi:tetratricopeptide (TPR) repeat protein